VSARRRNEAGTSAVEFALIALPLFMFLFGTLQYGYHYWAMQTASASAREAARLAAVGTAWDCVRSAAVSKADGPALGAVAVGPTSDPLPTGGIGSVVTVTVSFRSLDLGFLPLPSGGEVSESASARVETLPLDQSGAVDSAARRALCP